MGTYLNIANTIFSQNSVKFNPSIPYSSQGGGIAISNFTSIEIFNCTWIENQGLYGAGMGI